MKTLNIHFTDAEYFKLFKAKKASRYQNWHAFILWHCSKGFSVKKNLKGGKK